MRRIVLAASLLATFAAPAFAHTRHHVAMPNRAAAFLDVVPAGAIRSDNDRQQLNTEGHRCVWTAVCAY